MTLLEIKALYSEVMAELAPYKRKITMGRIAIETGVETLFDGTLYPFFDVIDHVAGGRRPVKLGDLTTEELQWVLAEKQRWEALTAGVNNG